MLKRQRGMWIRHLPLALGIGALIFAACSHHTPVDPTTASDLPKFIATKITSNVHNVLSAVVTARVSNATAVAIEYGADSLHYSAMTPLSSTVGDSVRMAVLGLEANRSYTLRAVALGSSGQKTFSAPFLFHTGELPDDLPRLKILTQQSPAAGFVMMGFASQGNLPKFYALIVDNDGKIVWYRKFPGAIVDFQKQENGAYTVFSAIADAPQHFYVLDNLGNLTQEIFAGNGWSAGPHELRLFAARYCLFSVEFRDMNLSAIGGLPNASVRGTNLEYYRLGTQPFRWSPLDHFQVTDAAPDIPLTDPIVNPWHGNAIEIDTDDNLIASFRNSDEITKINSRTGEMIWRWGGKQNQFTFVNDPLNGFSHQHGVRRLRNGNLILFDNGNLHSPPMSRAVEYKLNEQSKTAELVWVYRHEPPLYNLALGFVQRLANDNTLICYGFIQRVIEVDKAGNKRWELLVDEPNQYPYRAFRIESLY